MATDSPFLYFCQPCLRQRKYQIATYYCTNCGRTGAFICWQCKQHHEKFDEIRTHRIQAIENSNCSTDDTNGCSCDRLDLRSEQSGHQSSNRASNKETFCVFQKVQKLIDDYEKSQANLSKVEAKRLEGIEKLNRDKHRIKDTIKDIRQNLNKQLDRLEKESERELEIRFKRLVERINGDIEHTRDLSTRWKKIMKDLIKIESRSGVDLCVKILQNGEILRQKSDELWEYVGRHVEPERIDFIPCVDIINGKFDLKAFGNFVDDNIHEYNTSLQDEYDISIETDDHEIDCDITGCCVMSDGAVILADHSNANLKKLNETYKVVAMLNLPEPPCDLCPLDGSEVAVTLPKKKTVQFVTVTDDLKMSNSLYVGYGCMGIDYSMDLQRFYVTYAWPMQIRVFKKDGEFVQAIWSNEDLSNENETKNVNHNSNNTISTTSSSKDSKSMLFCLPYRSRKPKKEKQQIFTVLEDILVSSLQQRLYICDHEKGLIVLTDEGKPISSVRNFRDMPEFAPRRICRGCGDDFFVYGQSERTKEFGILHVGSDKKVESMKGDVLKMHDIADIEAMCFNRLTSQFIISTKSDNYIKVFNVF